MKKVFVLFLLNLFWLSAFTQTTLSKTITHGGLTRSYRIYIPAIYADSVSVPLLFNLHGYGSNNMEQEYYGDFRPIADTANFIIVHPNGTKDIYGKQFWNTFGGSTVDDVGFISALIDEVSALYKIDSTRIYSTGMSNGGFMSYKLACHLSNRITAIASVTGSMTYSHKDACSPQHPTPVMQIHGTADNVVPYNGSTSFVPIETLVNYWVQYNNCSSTPEITAIPDIDTNDGCTAERYLYPGGTKGTTVEFYKITGGGHSWPGAPVNTNTTNMDFSASKEIWRFFNKYSLNTLTSIHTNKESFNGRYFPNPFSSELMVENHAEELINIELYDNFGRRIEVRKIQSGNLTRIMADVLADGVYLLKITDKSSSQYHKVIKY